MYPRYLFSSCTFNGGTDRDVIERGGSRLCIRRVGTYTSKGTADHGGAEEETHACLKFVALVVRRSQVDDRGHNARLERTEKEAQHDKTFVRRDEAHTHVDDGPAQHKEREVVRGLELLKDHVARHLKQDEGDEEDL